MRWFMVAVAFGVSFPSQSLAEPTLAPAIQPGDWVYAIRETSFKPISDEPGDKMPVGASAQVRTVGDMLEVRIGSKAGTVPAKDVKRAPEALSHFTALVEKDPNDMSLRLIRAQVADSLGQWKTCVEDYTQLIRAEPKNVNYWIGRGIAQYRIRDFDQAILDCNEAIRLDDRLFPSYLFRAESYRELGEPLKALAGYGEALSHCDHDETRFLILLSRGQLHLVQFNLEEALDDFNRAVKINSQFATLYAFRGRILFFRGRYDEALRDLTKAVDLDENDAYAVLYRGDLFRKRKQYEKAHADFSRAVALAPNDPAILLAQASCFRDQGDHKAAMRICTKVLEMRPSLAIGYSTRGLIWQETGEPEKAIADYRHAIKLDPKSTNAHNALAWILATCPDEKLRDGGTAVVHAKLASEATKNQIPNMLDTLAAAYAESGKFELAIQHQQKALDLLTDEAEKEVSRTRLELYRQGKPYRDE